MSRLDILAAQKFNLSRQNAKEFVKNGKIFLNGSPCTKPSYSVKDDDDVLFNGEYPKYAGRGGLKLEHAIAEFKLILSDMICVDIGASTGGFTDCMLYHGASKIYAVDVGSSQLAPKLALDSRVVSMEKTDARLLDKNSFSENISFISVDVSFISLKHILPVVYDILTDNATSIILIKPQFEAGKSALNKNGIVKSPDQHVKVIQNISELSVNIGFSIIGISSSPIKGGKGNIEYLMCLNKSNSPSAIINAPFIVESSFEKFKQENLK